MLVRIILLAILAAAGYYANQQYQAWRELQRQHSHIAEGLMIASAAKTRIVEYYASEGVWPSSNQQLDLAPANEIIGNSLQSLEIHSKGVIELTYDAKSGVDGGRILLLPKGDERHLAIRWECWTDSYADVNSWAPQCVYEAP